MNSTSIFNPYQPRCIDDAGIEQTQQSDDQHKPFRDLLSAIPDDLFYVRGSASLKGALLSKADLYEAEQWLAQAANKQPITIYFCHVSSGSST